MERNTMSPRMLWKVLTQAPRSEFDHTLCHLERKSCVGDSRGNKSPLHEAVLYGKPENISELIIKENNVEIRSGSCKETPIHWSAKLGRLECLKRLIKYGGSLTAKDGSEEGNSAMHLAVIHGQEEITRWLIGNGVCVNSTNKKGITPLVYATWYGYTKLVQTLVEKGANVNCQTSCFNNATPLHLAVRRGKKDVIRTLLKFGADPTHFCCYNQTPVHWAAAYGNLQSLKIMEYYGVDLSVRMNDECGYQPIHLAAGSGHITLVEWFLDNGIAVDCQNKFGFTPLHLAAVNGHTETANFLLRRGAQVN
jgi:ankyrin repeat protein